MAPTPLREFRPTDLTAVLRIELASFPEESYSAALFLALYCSQPELFLVATSDESEDKAVVGYAVGAVERHHGRIISIAIDPSRRRHGLGRMLCDELIERLEGAGVGRIDLETRVDNRAAINLWRQLGFRRESILTGYYGGEVDALKMTKRLATDG